MDCDVKQFTGFEHFLVCHAGQVTFSGPDSYYVYPNGKRILWSGTRSTRRVLRMQFEFEKSNPQFRAA